MFNNELKSICYSMRFSTNKTTLCVYFIVPSIKPMPENCDDNLIALVLSAGYDII